MGYSLGVDLGTTFAAAAMSRDDQVEMVTLGNRSVVMPTVVALRDDGTVLTGEAAMRRAASHPDRAATGFKRRLGDPTPMLLGGERFTAVELLSIVLRDVLARVTATEGAPPDRVVLTHPANWGPFRRGLFEEVPALAGLSDIVTITEPEAAAAHYAASRELEDGQVVAVYDLGGGTFDVTVLRKRPSGIDILGVPEGIERLGGIDFDEAVLSHVDNSAGGALRELDARDPQVMVALARLRMDCVLAKESLSTDTETTVPVFLPGRHFEVPITRAEFEDLVRAQVESTVGALARTLRSAQVEPDELSAVLLVGGSSRIPLVAEMVSEELGRPTVVDTHPKYAVALGAATHLAPATAVSAAPARSRSTRDATGTAPAADAAPSAPPHPDPDPPAPDIPAPSPTLAPTPDAATSASSGATQGEQPDGPPPAPQPPAAPASTPAAAPPPPPDFPAPVAAAFDTPATGYPVRSFGAPPEAQPPSDRPRRVRRALLLTGLAAVVLVIGTTLAVKLTSNGPEEGTSSAQSGPPDLRPANPSQQAPPDTPPPSLVATATIPVGQQPGRVAITPDGGRAYVTNFGSDTVSVVGSGFGTETIRVGQQPSVVAIAPNGRFAYVTGNGSGDVSVLNTSERAIVATVKVGIRPSGLAVTPDGGHVYVASQASAAVAVIDTATNTVTTTIPASEPAGVAITPDGRYAYVTNFGIGIGPGNVSVIDTSSNSITATIPAGVTPGSIAISPDGAHAYVTNFSSNTVTVIDTARRAVTSTVPVGQNPANLAVTPDSQHILVTNQDDNTLSVLDAGSDTVVTTVPIGSQPNGIAIAPDGRTGYVTNSGTGTITRFKIG
ncbi:MAG TPA: Hsp70 family protein [Pseudonocardia sp.]|nr:Hsp70 family protein [Pseudonocardia sp.]